MSVGILPGMASWAAAPAVDTTGSAAVNAGAAVPRLGSQNVGGRLSLSLGADGTVAGTILVFALLYFGVMAAWHQLDRLG